jgi:hypothetical protein
VIVDSLESLARDKAINVGMPHVRLAFTPTPVGGKTREELWSYVNGKDPVSEQAFMAEIVDYLTRPLNEDEMRTGLMERPKQRLLGPFTQEEMQVYFDDRFWSENLPIVAPTEERVAEMLKGTSHKPDEQIGTFSAGSASRWGYTVETAAINAVMAGAKREHFPAILAIAASRSNPRGSSTSSMTTMAVFNGPIVDELLLNSGTGALQAVYSKSGAVIGRAWALLAGNTVGGSAPGTTYLGNQGNPMGTVPAVFAENVAGLPEDWDPLHVQKGFGADENVVSTFGGCQSMSMAQVFKDENWGWHLKRTIGGLGSPNQSSKLLLIDPAVTGPLLRFGFDTKEKLIDWVKENVTMSKFNYWLDQDVINHKRGIALSGREPYASWLALPDDAQIAYLENVNVVVVGGSGNVRWSVNECGYGGSVRVDDWR